MRIYVACLASYNNGVLHGRWIDVSSDADEMMEEISAMLRGSNFPNVEVDCPDCMGVGESFPTATCKTCNGRGVVPSAEEWAIHDYEDFPDLGEYVGLDTIAKFAELVEEYAYCYGPKDMAAIIEHFGSVEEAASRMEDDFIWHYDSFLDYASEYADECLLGDASDEVAAYFDYQAFARDLKMEFEVVNLPSGGVAIFHIG